MSETDNFSHRAGYAADPLAVAMKFARKGGTLAAGEGALLVQEIERLQAQVKTLAEAWGKQETQLAAVKSDWQRTYDHDCKLLIQRAEKAESRVGELLEGWMNDKQMRRLREEELAAAIARAERAEQSRDAALALAKSECDSNDAYRARAERAEAVLATIHAALAELSTWPDLPNVPYGIQRERDGKTSVLAVRGDQVIGVMEAIHRHVQTLAPFGEKAVQALYERGAVLARAERAEAVLAKLREPSSAVCEEALLNETGYDWPVLIPMIVAAAEREVAA